jgi:CBS domain-containing protein
VSRRPIVRDRERRTSEAFRLVRETAAKVGRLRGGTTADARAVGVVADVLGALVGLIDAYDGRRSRGEAAGVEKRDGAALVGVRVLPTK